MFVGESTARQLAPPPIPMQASAAAHSADGGPSGLYGTSTSSAGAHVAVPSAQSDVPAAPRELERQLSDEARRLLRETMGQAPVPAPTEAIPSPATLDRQLSDEARRLVVAALDGHVPAALAAAPAPAPSASAAPVRSKPTGQRRAHNRQARTSSTRTDRRKNSTRPRGGRGSKPGNTANRATGRQPGRERSTRATAPTPPAARAPARGRRAQVASTAPVPPAPPPVPVVRRRYPATLPSWDAACHRLPASRRPCLLLRPTARLALARVFQFLDPYSLLLGAAQVCTQFHAVALHGTVLAVALRSPQLASATRLRSYVPATAHATRLYGELKSRMEERAVAARTVRGRRGTSAGGAWWHGRGGMLN